MDNEVEVEKMAKTVNGLCHVPCKECKEQALCEVLHIAEELVEEGYRKADEVCKETVKEILQAMNEKMNMLTGCGVPYHVKQFMKEIAMQYDIEVDE